MDGEIKMSELIDNNPQIFCWVCGNNPEDTPKILSKYNPSVFSHLYYCKNCENYFILDTDNFPKKILKDLVKYCVK